MKSKYLCGVAIVASFAMVSPDLANAGKLKNAVTVYKVVRDSVAYDLAKEAAKRLLAGTKCKGSGNSGTANSTPQTC